MVKVAMPLAVFLILGATPAFAQDSGIARLSTKWLGPDVNLEVVEGGSYDGMVQMMPAGDTSGQLWTIVDEREEYVRLKSVLKGESRCLDVFNGGEKDGMPHFARCGNFAGQYWIMQPWGDAYRLTSLLTGKNMCLDVLDGGELNHFAAITPCADRPGQLWHVAKQGSN